MKKFLMLAAVVALVAAALAVPALAQRNDDDFNSNERFDRGEFFGFLEDNFDSEEEFFDFFNNNNADNGFDEQQPVVSQEIGQEAQSGDVAMSFDVSSSGDYAQQCAAPLQFGNTGNLQNAQGFVQYGSESDDVSFEGSTFEFSPALGVQCEQAVQQSSAASSYGY